jgi:SRSO17 transposase
MVKPRSPRPTVQCVDTYCELYRDLFIEVRAYESFKYLQLGLISDCGVPFTLKEKVCLRSPKR